MTIVGPDAESYSGAQIDPKPAQNPILTKLKKIRFLQKSPKIAGRRHRPRGPLNKTDSAPSENLSWQADWSTEARIASIKGNGIVEERLL